MSERPEPTEPVGPEVMFLPLAVSTAEGFHGFDPATYARRLPDFLHQVLNEGHAGPTAMLELQSTTEQGPVRWVQFDEPPDRDEAFELLPPGLEVRAVVTGELAAADGGLRVEFHVYRSDDDAHVTAKVGGTLSLEDPVAGLLRLARHLARLLEMRFVEPKQGLLTHNGEAFRLFLQGLDNAMLLSGDLDIAVPADRDALMRPFAEALALDPSFGLALRVANATAAVALDGARLDSDSVRSFLDQCYETQPVDGDACVAIAEQLSDMGEDERAFAWLEHAALLDPPPPRGLESLGLLMARRGDVVRARELWQKGLAVDGHPDFFSHLAQLEFVEDHDAEAWQLLLRGLRRLRERTVRAGEWDDAEPGGSVLLECLHAQLLHRQPPDAVVAAIGDLRGLSRAEDQVFLGLCLLAVGQRREARSELVPGVRSVTDLEVRDLAVRALLQLDVADFEPRFARACDRAVKARNPRDALAEFQLWLQLQPEFWPALYFSALAKRRLGEPDEALDLLAAALEVAPGQPDVLFAMAEAFDRRRNPKRAIELVDAALEERPDDVRLHGARARYLRHLGRTEEARRSVAAARASGLDSPELRRLARRLRRG